MFRPNIIIALAVLIYSALPSQDYQIQYEDLSTKEGLLSNLGTDIIEDNLGNIWIGTQVGLSKYNGYECVNYYSSNSPLISKAIHGLYKDNEGRIWASQVEFKKGSHKDLHKERRLITTIFDPASNQIYPLDSFLVKSNIPLNSVTNIIDAGDQIFIEVLHHKIYHWQDNTFNELLQLMQHEEFLGLNKDSLAYIFNGSQILLRDNSYNTLESFDLKGYGNIELISADGKNGIYFYSKLNNTLNSYYFDGYTINKLSFKFGLPHKHDFLTRFKVDASEGHEKFIQFNYNVFINGNEIPFTQWENAPKWHIEHAFRAKSGLFYFATLTGIKILSIENKPFTINFNQEDLGSTRGIFTNEDFDLVNTYQGTWINNKSNKYDLSFIDTIPTNRLVLYEDPTSENIIWCTSHSNIVYKYDIDNETTEQFYCEGVHCIDKWSLIKSSLTNKCYATSQNGLFSLTDGQKVFQLDTLHHLLSNEGEMAFNLITEIDSMLWISTTSGLFSYNEQTHHLNKYDKSNSPITGEVYYIDKDISDPGIFWISSRGQGLVKWNRNTNQGVIISDENGLSNNDIHTIYQDSSGFLWLPTNKNLNRVSKTDLSIKVYTIDDGIAGSEFNNISHFKDAKGMFHFGGVDGVTSFHPDQINSRDVEKIKLRPTKLVMQKDNSFEEHRNKLDQLRSIRIDPDINSLQISFTTDHLFDIKNTDYRYKIEGLDTDWTNQRENTVRLNRIPYGNYTLYIEAIPKSGLLKSETLMIDLHVIKPYYKRTIFRILGVFGFLAIVYLFYLWRISVIKKRNIYLEKVVEERTEELRKSNQIKNKIFAILAHDLRNPISSFTNITKKIKYLIDNKREKEIDSLTSQIEERLDSLSNNLDNILDWALLEQSTFPYRPRFIPVKPIIESIYSLYENQITDKNIVFVDSTEEKDCVYADETALQTILRNLIQNAVKFCPPEASIKLKYEGNGSGSANILILDTGPGIENSTNSSQKGMGMGLKIVKELLQINSGKLSILSPSEGGTLVILNLPITEKVI